MKNKLILGIFLIAIILAAGFYWRADLFSWYNNINHQLAPLENLSLASLDSLVNQVKEQVSAPEPLRFTETSPKSNLTKSGTVEWTNNFRAQNSLPPLKVNDRLNAAAKAKAEDMLKQQYFAHLSPGGVGPDALVKAAGYQFILSGENLALGNFADDQALLTAWMNSPGHRENILNPRYTEIGVAVLRGVYEGQETWLAVQEFGRPLSLCPAVDVLLKPQINDLKAQIEALAAVLESDRATLEQLRQTDTAAYNQAVSGFNAEVGQYNQLVVRQKQLVADYNQQVEKFNQCLGQ